MNRIERNEGRKTGREVKDKEEGWMESRGKNRKRGKRKEKEDEKDEKRREEEDRRKR